MERLKAFFVRRSYDLGVEEVRWQEVTISHETNKQSIKEECDLLGRGNAQDTACSSQVHTKVVVRPEEDLQGDQTINISYHANLPTAISHISTFNPEWPLCIRLVRDAWTGAPTTPTRFLPSGCLAAPTRIHSSPASTAELRAEVLLELSKISELFSEETVEFQDYWQQNWIMQKDYILIEVAFFYFKFRTD